MLGGEPKLPPYDKVYHATITIALDGLTASSTVLTVHFSRTHAACMRTEHNFQKSAPLALIFMIAGIYICGWKLALTITWLRAINVFLHSFILVYLLLKVAASDGNRRLAVRPRKPATLLSSRVVRVCVRAPV